MSWPEAAEISPGAVRAQMAGPQVAADRTSSAEPHEALTAVDPVCGMAVEVRTARHSLEHEGHTYYFCCPHCRAAFARDPARYLAAAAG